MGIRMGRPSDYSEELGQAVCDAIAGTPKGLDLICQENAGFPVARTVYRWLAEHPKFSQSYLRAREMQADLLFDQCIVIADDGSADTVVIGGQERVQTEVIARSKLRVDTRMRMAGKLAPKKYGDKLAIGGADDLPPVKHDVTHSASESYRRMCEGK